MNDKDMDLISIIIPVYNVSKYLRRCVDSVLSQTYKNIEIVLVDDGSTDDSGNICDEYAEKENSITTVHQTNQGLGPARNTGLDLAHGKYIGFVDSDDWVAPNMYEYMYKAMMNNGCDIVTCGRYVVSDEGVLSEVYCSSTERKIEKEEAVKQYLIQKVMNMSVCDKLFNRELFQNVRFPGDFYRSEDIVPMYQMLKKSKGVYLTGKPFYNYYYRMGSLSKSNFSPKTMGSYIYSEQVAKEVKTDFPELKGAADYFVLDEIIGMYRIIRASGYKGKEKSQLMKKMKKSFSLIMKNEYLYKRQKLYAILAFIRMDKIFDKMYVVLKRGAQRKHAKRSKK